MFTAVSRELGPYLKCIPDGETGERLDWITWLEPVFAEHPAFEPSDEVFQLHGGVQAASALPAQARRRRSRASSSDNLFYGGDIAIRSLRRLRRAEAARMFPRRAGFQIDLVPAHSVIWLYVQEDLQRAVDTLFNDAVLREIDKIAAAIAARSNRQSSSILRRRSFARLERAQRSPYGATKEEMQETFTQIVLRLANRVPADIDLLFHFCYGDAGHKHVVEPTDMGDMVEFANRLSRQVYPADPSHPYAGAAQPHADDAYFAPLDRLKLKPDTELCLGLVHYTDGVDGTVRWLDAAKKHRAAFRSRRVRFRAARSRHVA